MGIRGLIARARALESMDLDVILLERIFAQLGLIGVGEKVHHFGAMIPLELDHLTHVLVLDDSAIASYSSYQLQV